MKKVLTLLLTLTMVLTFLTSCGEESSTKTESVEGKTIVVGRWGGNEAETAAFGKLLEEFTTETGIEVEERVYSDYNTELQAELIGGTGPDVFYVDAFMAPFFISQDVLLPLDETEYELDQFYAPLKDAFKSDGEYYAISKDYSTLALYYNKAMVNEADIPKTLEEIWESDFLVELQATLPEDTVAMTYNIDLARNMFIAENGGNSITTDEELSNIGSEAIIENLKLQLTAAKDGKMVEPKDLGFGWNGDIFGNGKTAIMIEGNWVLGFLQQNFADIDFGVIEVPTYKDEKGTMVFTVGYGINAATKEEAAASAFVKFSTGTQGMATWTTGAGVLPSRIDVTEETNAASDPLKAPHIAGAEYATAWQKGTFLDTINQEFRNYAPSIVKGERTLEEGMKLSEEEANKIIIENK